MRGCRASWRLAVAGALAGALLAGAARASDTSRELLVGGLDFALPAEVVREAEEIAVSPERVVLRYRLFNPMPVPATATITFALPDIDVADLDTLHAFPSDDDVNFVGFSVRIDGQPVTLAPRQQALLGGRDVTATLRAAGLRLLPRGAYQERIRALGQEERERLVAQGLLVEVGTDDKDEPRLEGAWTVRTHFVRRHSLPSGRALAIELRYRASIGRSFDTVLRKAVRESAAMEAEYRRYLAEYCVPEALVRGIDRLAGAAEENVARLRERRIALRLRPEGAAAAPVKQFRLLVDKGEPHWLVAFCGTNVVRLSPTTFEMRTSEQVPPAVLKILMIEAAAPQASPIPPPPPPPR